MGFLHHNNVNVVSFHMRENLVHFRDPFRATETFNVPTNNVKFLMSGSYTSQTLTGGLLYIRLEPRGSRGDIN